LSSCVLSKEQFERTVESSGLFGASVSNIIDNTGPGMGVEQIGYTITSGEVINLDAAMNSFKASFSNVNIKIYPFNYNTGCSNFDDIYSSFLSTNSNIGIIIGVTGENSKPGNIWWQTISKDDGNISPPPHGPVDSIFFFNKGKYKGATKSLAGSSALGVIQNNNLNSGNIGYFTIDNKDKKFRFADDINTPRGLGVNDGAEFNSAQIMTKDHILALLAEVVKSPYGTNGTIKKGAFDKHLSNYWALALGSKGWDGPFDYSTKNFIQDNIRSIFVTDDGANVIGHDYRNMGNFLWGAATYIMGVPQVIALSAANLNNLFSEPGVKFDSPDDQYSIKLGRYFAKIMGWKNLAGIGNANILK
jgi:hypothetical protein